MTNIKLLEPMIDDAKNMYIKVMKKLKVDSIFIPISNQIIKKPRFLQNTQLTIAYEFVLPN